MHTFLKIVGTLLFAFGTIAVALLGWLASKGLFTAKEGLIVRFMQGRITPIPASTVLIFVLSIIIMGLVLFVLGEREQNIGKPSQTRLL
jgi:hypothetical protein